MLLSMHLYSSTHIYQTTTNQADFDNRPMFIYVFIITQFSQNHMSRGLTCLESGHLILVGEGAVRKTGGMSFFKAGGVGGIIQA